MRLFHLALVITKYITSQADIIFPSIKNGTPRFTYLGLVKNNAYFCYPSRVPEFPSVYFYRFMLLIFLIICFVFFVLVIFIICLAYPMLPMSLGGSFIDCCLRFTPNGYFLTDFFLLALSRSVSKIVHPYWPVS